MELNLCPTCGMVPEKDRSNFWGSLAHETKMYKKGEFIVYQDDPISHLYVLNRGKAKAEMVSDCGLLLDVEIWTGPMPLFSGYLFGEHNRFPVAVMAMEECEVYLILKKTVIHLLTTNEYFLNCYMAYNADRTRALTERIQYLSFKTIKGKLAYYILKHIVSNHYVAELNQTELADYFGVSRPSLARCFTEIIDEGAITRGGDLLNLDLLRSYIR